MSVIACIPTKDRADLAYRLAKRLIEDDGLRVVIADNGAPREPMIDIETLCMTSRRGVVLNVRDRALHGRIYRLWNMLWDRAIWLARDDPEPVEVAFVNDDAWPALGALAECGQWLRTIEDAGIVYPDYDVRAEWSTPGPTTVRQTSGTYRHGGMCGWCFVVPGELELRFDEDYRWWCGDDDFAFQVARAGLGQYRVVGVGCDHLHEATAQLNPWTEEAKGMDMERLHSIWGTGT